jgi:hypothetical protein
VGKIISPYNQQKPPLGSQINWGHPLSRGLVGCWLFNEGGGFNCLSLVNPSFGSTITATPAVFNLQNSPLCRYGDGSATYFNGKFPASSDISVVFSIYALANGTYFSLDTTTELYDIKLRNDRINWAGDLASVLAFPQNASQQMCFTKNGLVHNAYRNTIAYASRTTASARTPNQIFLGKDELTTYGNCYFGYAYVWNRVLSAQEIMSLYVAPYQMIQPRRIWIGTGTTPPATIHRRMLMGAGI